MTSRFIFRKHSSREKGKICDCQEIVKRNLVSLDYDKFLVVTNDTGCQLTKIGTGYQGSVRGHVYSRSNICLEPGMLVEVNGILIHRPNNYDSKEDLFGTVIDLDTFEKKIDIILSENLAIKRNTVKSIALLKCNDKILWLKQILSDPETMNYLPQSYITVIDYCTLESNSENCTMKVTERRLLTKSIESPDVISKVLNLLLMPCKTSSATESDVPMKFPTDNNSTSAGLRMATFQESAITCDGTFLTVLAPNPDSRGKLSKCLGTAFSFELEKGTLHLSFRECRK